MNKVKSSTTYSLYPFGSGRKLIEGTSVDMHNSYSPWNRCLVDVNECKSFYPPSPTCSPDSSYSQSVLWM